ncbi:hypothetical protein [Lysobacter enzymogenes]|jgi:hypothetical protein|uniref:hypothetical protein n=1 Tax=Lysobacter enzymogenes TaxID=69 RepID=UPI0009C85391|nr:hypothetical protein [Lysobacter enzymogenes]UZW62712.1 hypothetical protein BV903_010655 [Lysobacter enzymogenes]
MTKLTKASSANDELPNQDETNPTADCLITAVIYEGLSAQTIDGRRATLAVIDSDGNVIASGHSVESAAWEAAVKAYRDYLMGKGHIRTLVKPERKAA